MKISYYPFGGKLFAAIIFLVLLLAASPLYAARILVIGDSWGVAAGPALQAALVDNGSLNTVASIAVRSEEHTSELQSH